jgi:hypothetical protein
MKKALIAIAITLLAQPAKAIFLTIHHDTEKKLDISLDWHHPLDPFMGKYVSPITDISVDWSPVGDFDGVFPDYIQADIYITSALFHDEPGTFTRRVQLDMIYQPWPDKFIELLTPEIPGHWRFAKDQMSGRFIFREQDYLPRVAVPDHGNTLGLLAIAIAGIPFLRRIER